MQLMPYTLEVKAHYWFPSIAYNSHARLILIYFLDKNIKYNCTIHIILCAVILFYEIDETIRLPNLHDEHSSPILWICLVMINNSCNSIIESNCLPFTIVQHFK